MINKNIYENFFLKKKRKIQIIEKINLKELLLLAQVKKKEEE